MGRPSEPVDSKFHCSLLKPKCFLPSRHFLTLGGPWSFFEYGHYQDHSLHLSFTDPTNTSWVPSVCQVQFWTWRVGVEQDTKAAGPREITPQHRETDHDVKSNKWTAEKIKQEDAIRNARRAEEIGSSEEAAWRGAIELRHGWCGVSHVEMESVPGGGPTSTNATRQRWTQEEVKRD